MYGTFQPPPGQAFRQGFEFPIWECDCSLLSVPHRLNVFPSFLLRLKVSLRPTLLQEVENRTDHKIWRPDNKVD